MRQLRRHSLQGGVVIRTAAALTVWRRFRNNGQIAALCRPRGRRLAKVACAVIVSLCTLLSASIADASTCIWNIAVGNTGNFTASASWTSCASTYPQVGDTASFDGTKDGNCTFDASKTVAAITIASGYTGTITVSSAVDVTVTGNFSLAGGTYVHGTGDLTIQGDFLFSGGAFTAPSGLMEINGAFNATAGTFAHNSGTVLLNASASEAFASNSFTFNNLYINDGLIAYWKFDESSGPSPDLSGWGRSATWNGAPATSSSTLATGIDFANARSINIGIGSSGINEVHFTSPAATKITVSAWINQTNEVAGNTKPRIFDFPGYWLFVYPSTDGTSANRRKLQFQSNRATTDGVWRADTTTISLGTWYHVAVSYDSTSGAPSIYINGTLQSLTTVTSPSGAQTSNIGTGYIGNDPTTHTRVFGGYFDDFRIYNRQLSARSIRGLAMGKQTATSNSTQTLSGSPTINGDFVLHAGTFDVGTSSLNVKGSWINTGAVVTATGGTVTFNGTSTGKVIRSNGQMFQTVTVNGSGGGWTLEDDMELSPARTLTMTAGSLDLSSYTLRVGNIDANGAVTITPNTGNVILDANGNRTLDAVTLYDVELEPVSATTLAGYWKADEGQGIYLNEYSGNSLTGTLSNNGYWTDSVLPTTNFVNRAALQLTGADDVAVAEAVVATNAAFSACAWVRMTNTAGGQTFLSVDGTNISGFYLEKRNDTGKFAMVMFPSDSTGATLSKADSSITPSADTWYHLCGTYDTSNLRIYVNGALQGTQAFSSAWNATGSTYIGSGKWGAGRVNYVVGYIDDVRFYSAALTTTQVNALYNGAYPAGLAGTPTYLLGSNTTVTNSFKMHGGTLDTSIYTVNASSASNVATVYGGTYKVGSAAQTFAGGLNVSADGTLNLPTSSGSVKIGSTKTLNIDGTLSASSTGATIQTAGGASTYYNFNVGTSLTATPTLDITGLAVKNTTSNGMYINSVAGSSTTFTNFDNIAFSGGTGSYLLRIYATSLALYGDGLTFDNSTTSNLKLAGNGTGDGETRTYFGATCTSTPCETYDADDDSEPDGTGDTGVTGDEAVAQWLRGAYDDTSGTIQGFPTTAFDWNTFVYWNTYVAYRDYGGGADRLLARNTDGAYLNSAGGAGYYWDLPGSVGDMIGTPRWTQEGVSPGAVTHYVYILTTLGYVYKLSDSGTAFTLVTTQAWPYRNGASATATSALAMDSNNVYWTGNDGTGAKNMFSLTTAKVLNGIRPVVADVVASPALATVSSIDYLFTATNGKIYRTPTNVSSEITSTVSTSTVYGRVTPYGGKVYFPEDIGKVWALLASDLTTSWFYQDTNVGRHASGCTANSACTVRNLYVDPYGGPRLYFGDKDGHVYVLTSAGAILNANYPFRPGLSTDEFQTAPLYRSGVIVIGSVSGKVFVIDQNNGTGPALYQTYDFRSAISTISYDTDGYYVVGTADGKLYYLNGVTDPTAGSI